MPWACKQAAQTYDHESGEPQERFRIEPSISGTHSGCAHRLDRATQSVTGHWRGEIIKANENRSTSIQDAHELPCTNALSVHIPTHATHRHTACQQPPPCLVSLACLRLRSSVRSRQVAIIASIFLPSRLPVRAAQSCSLGIECSGSRVPESFLLGLLA